MVVANVLCEKIVFLKYFEGWDTKDVCFIVVSRPSEFWKNLVRRDHVCNKTWLVTFIFAGMRRLRVYTKVKPGQHLLLDLTRRYEVSF